MINLIETLFGCALVGLFAALVVGWRGRRTVALMLGLFGVACLVLATAMEVYAASPTSATATSDESAIRDARAAQNRAIVAGDVARIAEFWTDDVEIRRGLGQLVVGRAEYSKLFADDRNRDSALVYQREPTAVDVSPKWPLAYESGTWAGHLKRVDGPAIIRGRYSAQWVKRGNRWLIRGEVYVALTCAGAGCAFSAAP